VLMHGGGLSGEWSASSCTFPRQEYSLRQTGPGGRMLSAAKFCYQECRAAVDLVQTAMLTNGKSKDQDRNERVELEVRS
jgi:hypothetical protein